MLILPIKKQWYYMILSGEKKEEYREIKPYYSKRFANKGLITAHNFDGGDTKYEVFPERPWLETLEIMFRNGYSADSPSFVAVCTVNTGYGNPDWGAEPGKEYYVLKILDIESE